MLSEYKSVAAEVTAPTGKQQEDGGSSQGDVQGASVMSVIGHIIGLGNRHLDNVLVYRANGQVVHNDYNIFIAKRKSLQIPESSLQVDKNIISVFRVAGVEGMFRHICEHLRLHRKG